ncbi:hypothetical protein HYS48_00960 [Candidatus Woesearchaeota archaeon]|nr:hypothetical protein [Candidatus Woesearchaeota archaeon]
MEVQEILEAVENSHIFQQWKKKYPTAFLSFLFAAIDQQQREWQVGFYDEKEDAVTTFQLGEEIILIPPEKVFKAPGSKVLELHLEKVKVDLASCLEKVAILQKLKYPLEIPIKRIAILQHLDMGQVYNVTYITQTFKTLNVKVDAATEEILQDQLISIIQPPGGKQ